MREIELKFQVPADRLVAVRRAVGTASARTETLVATYFDTPGRDLARRGVAWRIRREGRRWVQTAKAAGPDPMSRLEHDVDLGTRRLPAGTVPDLARHAAHPELLDALHSALSGAGAPLAAIYSTEIQRTRRVVRHAGARVELALDVGKIEAGGASLPVCELEFELLDGPPASLVELAAAWARRHRLWLDIRSKAQRGDHLARGAPPVAAARTRPVVLKPSMPPAEALALGLQGVLAVWLANAAELADGPGPSAEAVHQLRVALRRTRVLLAVYGDWLPGSAAADADAGGLPLEAQVAQLFRELGRYRDQDVLSALLGGPLHAGGYALPLMPAAGQATAPAIAERVTSPAFTGAALALLRRLAAVPAVGPAPDAPADPGSAAPLPAAAPAPRLRRSAERALAREWKKFSRDAARFAALEHEQQHRVRKRAKRLRYALDFSQSLFPARKVARFLDALAAAQDAMGAYTDVLMGEEHLRRCPPDDAATAFARGWLSARREATLAACERPIRRLLKAERPWD